jgi:hypothetical protein
MTEIVVSEQGAATILRKERGDCWEWDMDDLRSTSFFDVLLKTGAKLLFVPKRGFLVSGYAYDGKDVAPYSQYEVNEWVH